MAPQSDGFAQPPALTKSTSRGALQLEFIGGRALPSVSSSPSAKSLELFAPPTVFGNGSVLDVLVCGTKLPYPVPVRRYLDEALVGMRLCPETADERDDIIEEMAHDKPAVTALEKWALLWHVLQSKCAEAICKWLFWIVVCVLFGRASKDVAACLRENMSWDWHQVMLAVQQRCPRVDRLDSGADFVMDSMPVLLTQALYRLLYDAFPSDKSIFSQLSQPLLDKLTHIVHYEVAGFRQNLETCREARSQLMLDKVLLYPHSDVFQQRRQDKRKKTILGAPRRSLAFGRLRAEPLEDLQLEHVMRHREERLEQRQAEHSPAASGAEKQRDPLFWPVPRFLNVSRYVKLQEEGDEMFDDQFAEVGLDDDSSCGVETPTCPLTPPQPAPPGPGITQSWPGSPIRKFALPTGSETEAEKPAILPRMSVMAGGSRVRGTRAQSGPSKEELARRQRERDDLVRRRIMSEPLPANVNASAINTGWVSPMINRLAPAERDRHALQKSVTEARLLNMVTPKRMATPKRTRGRPGTSKGASLPPIVSSASAPALLTTTGDLSSTVRAGSPSAAKRGTLQPNPVQQRDLLTDLDSPHNIKSQEVMRRLEAYETSAKAKSFGNYVREYDINTGTKKSTVAPEVFESSLAAVTARDRALGICPGSRALRFASQKPRGTSDLSPAKPVDKESRVRETNHVRESDVFMDTFSAAPALRL